MHTHSTIVKICVFIFLFTVLFFVIRDFNLLPSNTLSENLNSIPWLFSAIALIFSIISGFVIQSQWHTWDELTDASHGELTMLRQLHSIAAHFPKEVQTEIRQGIYNYLHVLIQESLIDYDRGNRSPHVEAAMEKLENTMFTVFIKFHQTGEYAFDLLRRAMEYREKRLQTSSHHLPPALRFFIIFATTCMVLSSLFIVVGSILYFYLLTLIIGLLAYGLYLLIDDLDHPYRPGTWHLTPNEYKLLLDEIRETNNFKEH